MKNVFRSKKRLNRNDTTMINIGLSKEQMKLMSMSFKNRSLAVSSLSRWVLKELIEDNKTLIIDVKQNEYSFNEKENDGSIIVLNNADEINGALIKRSVLIDNSTLYLIKKSGITHPLYKILPALTIYAINSLSINNMIFIQDKKETFTAVLN